VEKTVKDNISLDIEDIVHVVKEVESEKKEKEDATAAPLILDAFEESATEKKIVAPVDSKVVASDKKPVVVKAVPIGEKNIASKEGKVEISDYKNDTLPEKTEAFQPEHNSIGEETLEDEEEGIVKEEPKEIKLETFKVWAEQKIKEDEEKKPVKNEKIPNHGEGVKANAKVNGVASSGARMKKNYASPDCGAKIVGANPGSQGAANVITASRDDYFLNKCTDKSWFIVELCESIKALKIEIANFELFSSSPKQFKVYLGNVFPGRESDWVEFGDFTYTDERMIQSFKSDVGIVGKYLKLEILSNHGTEHYCPVSVFRVYGISDIELMSLDETHDDDDDDGDDTPEGEKPNSDNILLKTIKDAVDKVVNVFSRDRENQTMSATLNTSSLDGATLRYDLVPSDLYKTNTDHYHMIYYLMANNYGSLRQYLYTVPIERVLQERCAHFGVNFSRDNCSVKECGLKPWEWVRFLEAIHGEQFLLTLCNILSVEKGESLVSVSTGVHGKVKQEGSSDKARGEEEKNVTLEKRVDANVTKEMVVDGDVRGDSLNEQVLDVTKEEKVNTEETPIDVKTDRSEEDGVTLEEKIVASGAGAVETVQVVNNEAPKGAGAGVDSKVTSVGPIDVTKPPPSSNQRPIESSSAPAQASQSTWQKLSNRIKALERNVTLSTGFLEELSLRYVKQIDELNEAVKDANEAIVTTNKKQDLNKQTNEKMEKKILELTTTVKQLNQKIEKLQDEVMSRHGLLLLAEVLCLGLVLLACRPNPRAVLPPPSGQAPSRRHSMEIPKPAKEVEKRRQSIAVAHLTNGQFGARVEEAGEENLTKRQKKRRRRKGSRQEGLKNVQEDELEVSDDVYATFHGNSKQVAKGTVNVSNQTLKRSSSFSRVDESKFGSEHSLEERHRFSVEPVKITVEVSNGSHHYQQVSPREHHRQLSPRDHQYQHEEEGVVYQQRRARVSTPTRAETSIEVSNKFGLLNHSSNDVEDVYGEESENTVFVFPRQKKAQRSKSKSPSRQPNLIAKQRKVLFKNFRPENAEWLKNTQ